MPLVCSIRNYGASLVAQLVKYSTCNAGDMGSMIANNRTQFTLIFLFLLKTIFLVHITYSYI